MNTEQAPLSTDSSWQDRSPHFWGRGLMLSAWMVLIVAGFLILLRYEFTPGSAGQPPDSWPHNSFFTLAPAGKTILLFAHPQCPCTKATFAEFADVLQQATVPCKIHLVWLQQPSPKKTLKDLVGPDLQQYLPESQILWDSHQEVLRTFQVRTSGHVLIFNTQGDREFSGGITGGRGRIGLNSGKSALLAWLTNQPAEITEFHIYGCPLGSI